MELLFPVDAGSVYILDKNSKNLFPRPTLGAIKVCPQRSFSPEQCWAVEKGPAISGRCGKKQTSL